MGKIVFESEADFIANFNKVKTKLFDDIISTLSNFTNPKLKVKVKFKHLYLINWSDMNDWSVRLKSEPLQALAHKITHMVYSIGSPESVMPMLLSIANDTKKKHTKHNKGTDYDGKPYPGEYLGQGHFRWNHRVYILNAEELEYLNEYIKSIK